MASGGRDVRAVLSLWRKDGPKRLVPGHKIGQVRVQGLAAARAMARKWVTVKRRAFEKCGTTTADRQRFTCFNVSAEGGNRAKLALMGQACWNFEL